MIMVKSTPTPNLMTLSFHQLEILCKTHCGNILDSMSSETIRAIALHSLMKLFEHEHLLCYSEHLLVCDIYKSVENREDAINFMMNTGISELDAKNSIDEFIPTNHEFIGETVKDFILRRYVPEPTKIPD